MIINVVFGASSGIAAIAFGYLGDITVILHIISISNSSRILLKGKLELKKV